MKGPEQTFGANYRGIIEHLGTLRVHCQVALSHQFQVTVTVTGL